MIVAGFIATLKVALTAVFGQPPTAPARGITEITVGGVAVVHVASAVVKVHT
jgi:hypothetical protein